jgi:hypothetical protein
MPAATAIAAEAMSGMTSGPPFRIATIAEAPMAAPTAATIRPTM